MSDNGKIFISSTGDPTSTPGEGEYILWVNGGNILIKDYLGNIFTLVPGEAGTVQAFNNRMGFVFPEAGDYHINQLSGVDILSNTPNAGDVLVFDDVNNKFIPSATAAASKLVDTNGVTKVEAKPSQVAIHEKINLTNSLGEDLLRYTPEDGDGSVYFHYLIFDSKVRYAAKEGLKHEFLIKDPQDGTNKSILLLDFDLTNISTPTTINGRLNLGADVGTDLLRYVPAGTESILYKQLYDNGILSHVLSDEAKYEFLTTLANDTEFSLLDLGIDNATFGTSASFHELVEISKAAENSAFLQVDKEENGNTFFKMGLYGETVQVRTFDDKALQFRSATTNSSGDLDNILTLKFDRLTSFKKHYFNQGIDAGGLPVESVGYPTEDDHAASKVYVDNLLGGAGGASGSLVNDNGIILAEALDDGIVLSDVNSVERLKTNDDGLTLTGQTSILQETAKDFIHLKDTTTDELLTTINTSGNDLFFIGHKKHGFSFQMTNLSDTNQDSKFAIGFSKVTSVVEHAFTAGADLKDNRIKNLADPVNPQDAATRAFVLANAGGGAGGGSVSSLVDSNDNIKVSAVTFGADITGRLAISEATNTNFFEYKPTGAEFNKFAIKLNSSAAVEYKTSALSPHVFKVLSSDNLETKTPLVIGYDNLVVNDLTNFLADVNLNDNKLTGLADPVDPSDAVTLAYLNANGGGGGGGSSLVNDNGVTLATATNTGLELYDINSAERLKTIDDGLQASGRLKIDQAPDFDFLYFKDTNDDKTALNVKYSTADNAVEFISHYKKNIAFKITDQNDSNAKISIIFGWGGIEVEDATTFKKATVLGGNVNTSFLSYKPTSGDLANNTVWQLVDYGGPIKYVSRYAKGHQFQVYDDANANPRNLIDITYDNITSRRLHEFSAGIDLLNNPIDNVQTPTTDLQAANKAYVDTMVGLDGDVGADGIEVFKFLRINTDKDDEDAFKLISNDENIDVLNISHGTFGLNFRSPKDFFFLKDNQTLLELSSDRASFQKEAVFNGGFSGPTGKTAKFEIDNYLDNTWLELKKDDVNHFEFSTRNGQNQIATPSNQILSFTFRNGDNYSSALTLANGLVNISQDASFQKYVQFNDQVNFNNKVATGVRYPTSSGHVASKEYVDDNITRSIVDLDDVNTVSGGLVEGSVLEWDASEGHFSVRDKAEFNQKGIFNQALESTGPIDITTDVVGKHYGANIDLNGTKTEIYYLQTTTNQHRYVTPRGAQHIFSIGDINGQNITDTLIMGPNGTIAITKYQFNGGASMYGNVLESVGTPTASDHAATKGYVDTKLFNADNILLDAYNWQAGINPSSLQNLLESFDGLIFSAVNDLAKEPALGNPVLDNSVLVSSAAGVRSWEKVKFSKQENVDYSPALIGIDWDEATVFNHELQGNSDFVLHSSYPGESIKVVVKAVAAGKPTFTNVLWADGIGPQDMSIGDISIFEFVDDGTHIYGFIKNKFSVTTNSTTETRTYQESGVNLVAGQALTITHNLNKFKACFVQVYDETTDKLVDCEVTLVDKNSVKLKSLADLTATVVVVS